MLSNFKAAHVQQDRISDAGKEKLQIFESCQQEILAFVTKCVSNQTQRVGGGMTGILDESVSKGRVERTRVSRSFITCLSLMKRNTCLLIGLKRGSAESWRT